MVRSTGANKFGFCADPTFLLERWRGQHFADQTKVIFDCSLFDSDKSLSDQQVSSAEIPRSATGEVLTASTMKEQDRWGTTVGNSMNVPIKPTVSFEQVRSILDTELVLIADEWRTVINVGWRGLV